MVLAERPCLLERSLHTRRDVGRELALERELQRHADDRDRLHLGRVVLCQRDRGRDHLLSDVADLHRDEDPRVVGSFGKGRAGLTGRDS
jgi:hypothetical protein